MMDHEPYYTDAVFTTATAASGRFIAEVGRDYVKIHRLVEPEEMELFAFFSRCVTREAAKGEK